MKKLCVFFLGVISIFFLHAQAPGTLVLPFGNNGIVLADFNGYGNRSYASILQTDGKIVLGGRSVIGNIIAPTFIRLLTDGSLDPSFGGDGIVAFIPVNATEYVEDMLLQPDGKILSIGHRCSSDTSQMQVIRMNPDGSFDNTFNGTGHKTISFGAAYDAFGYHLALQDDAKILIAGTVIDDAIHVHAALCRLNADGTLDNTFGNNGIVVMDIGNMHNYTTHIAIQGDKFIVGGISYPYNPGPYDYVTLARFNNNGTLDAGFGQNGIVSIEIYLNTNVLTNRGDMCLDEQGRILFGVFMAGIQSHDFALFRFLPDGPPDNSFGYYGLTITDMERDATISALAIQYDGKILAGGYQKKETPGLDFALVRYRDDGSLDPGFGPENTGIVITDPNTGGIIPYSEITSLHIDAEGRILAAGYAYNFAGNDDFAVAAYYSGLNVGIPDKDVENTFPAVYPNPFFGETSISFTLEAETRVIADVFNLQGKLVARIANRNFTRGIHQLNFMAEGIAPGMYLLQMTVGERNYVSRIVKQ